MSHYLREFVFGETKSLTEASIYSRTEAINKAANELGEVSARALELQAKLRKSIPRGISPKRLKMLVSTLKGEVDGVLKFLDMAEKSDKQY